MGGTRNGSPPSVPQQTDPNSSNDEEIEEWLCTEDGPREPGGEVDFLAESLAMTAIANKAFFFYLHPKEKIEDRARVGSPGVIIPYTGPPSKKNSCPYDGPKIRTKETKFPDEEYFSFALLQRDRGAGVDEATIPIPLTTPEIYSEIKYLDPIPKRAENVVYLLSDPRAHPAD